MLWGRISLVCFGLERLDMGDSSLYRTHWICRLRCSSKTIRISLELFRPLVAKIRYTPHHHDFWCVLNSHHCSERMHSQALPWRPGKSVRISSERFRQLVAKIQEHIWFASWWKLKQARGMRTGEANTRERLLGELLLRGREREQAGRESRVQDSTYGIYHTECVQGKEKVQPHQVEHAVKALKKKTTKLNFCFPCLCCDIQASMLVHRGAGLSMHLIVAC